MYCEYYQAQIVKDKIWFVAGCLRNEDHWTFDRALEGVENTLEFFVAPAYEDLFLSFMSQMKNKGYVLNLTKLPNRIEKEGKVC